MAAQNDDRPASALLNLSTELMAAGVPNHHGITLAIERLVTATLDERNRVEFDKLEQRRAAVQPAHSSAPSEPTSEEKLAAVARVVEAVRFAIPQWPAAVRTQAAIICDDLDEALKDAHRSALADPSSSATSDAGL